MYNRGTVCQCGERTKRRTKDRGVPGHTHVGTLDHGNDNHERPKNAIKPIPPLPPTHRGCEKFSERAGLGPPIIGAYPIFWLRHASERMDGERERESIEPSAVHRL